MKMNHLLAAVLLSALAPGGTHKLPRQITAGNRLHRDRAPRGSQAERDRIEAAEAKRQRKRLKRVVP